jgi:2-polyprenyl-3-methyl-5-hydroxy-6-metoxy-1,4-benzoquinol methylase
MSTDPAIPQNLSHFERVPCNICGSQETRLVFQKWSFRIVECVECGLVYINPRAFRIEEDDYFEGPYLSTIEKDGQLDPGIGTLYGEIIYNLSNRVASGKLLDVGCAMGHFLGFAKRYGWEVEGVECSPYAARYAQERFGARVHPVCVLEDAHLQEDFYDACVLVEVIEHLPDPRRTMTEVWRVLQPGGLAYVTTPNFQCYRSLLLREDWSAVIPVGHLYHFDSSSLRKLLSSIGFINVEDLTGPADFAAELDFAQKSGSLKLSAGELEKVRELARKDAAEKGAANGRGEGLVMCARKPWDSTVQQSASTEKVTRQAFKTSFEGCLVRRPGESPEDGKVYFVENGRKRWVTTADWIIAKGMQWPSDVQFITADELDAILPGPPLP